MKKIILLTILLLVFGVSLAYAASPVLFFSDLIDGPRTGWNGSSTKGAAVTVWGKNFGSSRGSNYITVAGVNLTNDSDYAEWGVTTNNARGLERITFWLNNNCATGAQTISVTIGSSTSNTLPFYVRTTGNIRFVDHTNGNNSYNGTQDTYTSGSNGPWKTLPYARQYITAGDILYIRNGTYTEGDTSPSWRGALLNLYGVSGTDNNRTAFVGYPGEYPLLDGRTTATRSIIKNYTADEANTGYIVLSKMKIYPYYDGVGLLQTSVGYFRVIAIEVDGLDTQPASQWQVGAFDVKDASNVKIYGCQAHHWGYDKFDHGIYAGGTSTNPVGFDFAWNEIHDLPAAANFGRTQPEPSGIY